MASKHPNTAKSPLQSKVALLTKHDKARVIEPVLCEVFSVDIVSTDAFDTDTLGTFDNTVARKLSPVETAFKKAYLACELTGLTQGMGSEGSFNSMITGVTVNHEVLAFVDTENKLEIIAFAEQFIGLRGIEAKDEVELAEKMQPFIEHYGQTQKWMLEQSQGWVKGLDYSDLLENITTWPCNIEPDFRAMNCPARQTTIAMAAKDLVRRLQSTCPKCDSVNFVEKLDPKNIRFLPCELCGSESTKRAPLSLKCDVCGFTEEQDTETTSASAMYCTVCNP
jgi:hypothetical protein